jgi:glyoxylase-like metal-dependent hydrolase (beta-lactamase superfamily II)
LNPGAILFSHCHVDHILGNNFACREYGLKPLMHHDSLQFLKASAMQGQVYGFEVEEPILPDSFIEEGAKISFGNQTLEAILVPGHADGSLCFYNRENAFLVAGDVLFSGSIGRTDLPTGDMDLLLSGISQKLFTLPDNVTVYPGHGPETSIGYEKENNPFF